MATTLADVLCGMEPGDKLQYANRYGQVFKGRVIEARLESGEVLMDREEWRQLGFGPELIKAADYALVACHWVEFEEPSAFTFACCESAGDGPIYDD